jgi:hypothetical protein
MLEQATTSSFRSLSYSLLTNDPKQPTEKEQIQRITKHELCLQSQSTASLIQRSASANIYCCYRK